MKSAWLSKIAEAVNTPFSLMLLVAFIAVGASGFDNRGLDLAVIEMLVRVVAIVGMSIFIANSGVLSFGHVGFMCLGGYSAAWLGCDAQWKNMMLTSLPSVIRDFSYSFPHSIIFSAVFAGLVAVVLGLALMRLSGIAATIATFGFLMVVNSVVANWDSLTAGTSSIICIPPTLTLGRALGFAIFFIGVAWFFQRSSQGLQLRTSRDDLIASRAIGVDVFRLRLLAFVLSAMICGIAGAMYSHFLGIMSPDTMYLDTTFVLLAMLVIGGMSSLSGAVVGVVFVSIVIEVLKRFEAGFELFSFYVKLPNGAQQLGLAISLALVLVLRPNGIVAGREIGLRRSRGGV